MEPIKNKAESKLIMLLPLPPLPLGIKEIIGEQVGSSSSFLKRQQPKSNDKHDDGCPESKRRRQTAKKSEDTKIFRTQIAKLISDYLARYRKASCHSGRITNDKDYFYLRDLLTNYIITKELKYCESIGRKPISLNDWKKKKICDYLECYMQKCGATYKRTDHEITKK